MTAPEWMRSVGGYPAHSGTLVRTARGVFEFVLMGTFYFGEKRSDGSVDVHPDDHVLCCDPPWIEAETEVIIEYADPPAGYPNGCHRLPTGAIRCLCPPEALSSRVTQRLWRT